MSKSTVTFPLGNKKIQTFQRMPAEYSAVFVFHVVSFYQRIICLNDTACKAQKRSINESREKL